MSYSGWKNWETWNVALWIDNEEPIYRERMRAKPTTAAECERFVRKAFPNGTPDMRSYFAAGGRPDDRNREPDGGLDAVDWDELAHHWRDDYEPRQDEPRQTKAGQASPDQVRECFNCSFAEIDDDGDVWIRNPQSGHWLDDEEIERLKAFLAARA